MNYQVLARKYRPQIFADVAGQQHVTITLMNAIEQGRVAHGYIFSGHRGIGKTTVARILAMALNCRNAIASEQRPSAEPCGVCESCTEIRAGNAVDVIEIDAATNRGIDEIRELRDAARYRPARDRYKIYILDEAHQITDAAFNALLKTLEEPPEHIVFMMATTQPEDIPQTVRSRCQHFSFRAVKLSDIVYELRSIAEHEAIEATDSALNLIAEAGDGSMRDALSVMDQAIASAPSSDGRARLDVSQVREMLGTVSNVVFERLLESIDGARTADLITTANDLMDAGNSPVQIARQFVRYLRSTLLAKIANLSPESGDEEGADLLQISIEERRRAARSAALYTEQELTRFLQLMLRTFDEVGYRQEPRLHLELGLLKLLHLRRLLPMEELLSQLPSPSVHARSPVPRVMPAGGQVTPLRRAEAGASASSGEGKTVASASPYVLDQQRRSSQAASFDSETTQVPISALVASPASQPGQSGVDGSTSESLSAVVPEPLPSPAASSGSELDDLRSRILDALTAAKGQSSTADALVDASWTLEGSILRAETQLSKTMLGLVLNAEAQQIIRTALAASSSGLRFEAVPLSPGAAGDAHRPVARPARSGSVEDRAQQHPVVQEAQRLFKAEIRNVIDLSTKEGRA